MGQCPAHARELRVRNTPRSHFYDGPKKNRPLAVYITISVTFEKRYGFFAGARDCGRGHALGVGFSVLTRGYSTSLNAHGRVRSNGVVLRR